MTAPERVYWSIVPDDAPYEPMGGAWDKGIWWLSVDEPSATETLGIEKWRARGCEVVEYVQREAYDAAVAERDEARAALAKMRTRAIAAEQLPAFEKGDMERAHQSCAADFKALHDRLEKAERERDEARRERDQEAQDAHYLQLSLCRAIDQITKLRDERNEAKRLLAEAVEARDEAMREAETPERERDAARAEVDRLRPVVEAAQDYENSWPVNIWPLHNALAAYRVAKGGR